MAATSSPIAGKATPPSTPLCRKVDGKIRRKTRRAEAALHDLKMVCDGFTMPQADYDKLKALKAVCLKHGVEVKKSELLRAGVLALAAMPVNTLVTRIRALAPVKAGRKKK